MESIKWFLCLEISVTFLSSVYLTNGTGVCPNGNGLSCCNNYYIVNNTCKECQPGRYGSKCSQNGLLCFYGALCRSKCNCTSNEICDLRIGCNCYACPPGSHGENCSLDCPKGFYGLFCLEKCNCETSCDKVIGCNVSGTLLSSEFKTQPVTGLPGSPENTSSSPFFSSVFYLSLAISVAAIVICILIGTTIYFARRSKKGGWSVYTCPLPENTVTVQEPQEEDYTAMLTNRTQHRNWENKERY